MKLNNIKLISSAMTLALFSGVIIMNAEPAKADWKCKVRHPSVNWRGEVKYTYSEACPHFHENQPPTFHGQYAPAPKNKLVNAGGKCLDVHLPDMRNNGGQVQVWDCNGEPQQQWSLRGNELVNAGGKCLDVHAPDMRNNGGRVQVWDCNGEPQQQWSLNGNKLVNAGGKCLDVHAPDMRNNGGRVQVWDCNGEPQQQWSF